MTENVNKKKYIIIGVIAVLIVSIVGTLAWYTFGTKKSSLVLVLGNSDELLITLSPYELNIVAAPVTNYTSMTDYVSVTATNSKTISTSFSFFYDIETIDSALASTAMKYAVTRSSTQGGTYTEVATGSFNGSTAGQHKVIYTENVPATTTYYYKIYTYLDGNSSNSNMEGKVLKTTMGADLNYYTVTFNANGGTVPISTMSVGYGSTYGNMPTPSKTNATFLGWSLLPSGYRQVEYIESTGSQSNNTGIASSNNITANVDAVFPNSGLYIGVSVKNTTLCSYFLLK